jgi:hypothetical protein
MIKQREISLQALSGPKAILISVDFVAAYVINSSGQTRSSERGTHHACLDHYHTMAFPLHSCAAVHPVDLVRGNNAALFARAAKSRWISQRRTGRTGEDIPVD